MHTKKKKKKKKKTLKQGIKIRRENKEKECYWSQAGR